MYNPRPYASKHGQHTKQNTRPPRLYKNKTHPRRTALKTASTKHALQALRATAQKRPTTKLEDPGYDPKWRLHKRTQEEYNARKTNMTKQAAQTGTAA